MMKSVMVIGLAALPNPGKKVIQITALYPGQIMLI
jgi:hypothetical protein